MRRLLFNAMLIGWALTHGLVMNTRSDQVWDEMQRQGFERLTMQRGHLPLAHNSSEILNSELNGERFRSRIAELCKVEALAVQHLRFRAYLSAPELGEPSEDVLDDRPRLIALMTIAHLFEKGNGAQGNAHTNFDGKVLAYFAARVSGHTMDYAYDVVAEPPRKATQAPTLRERVLEAFPALPEKWLRDTTNTFAAERHRPTTGTNSERVSLTYHIFKVVDGPVTWEYHVVENKPYIDVEKHDSQEDDPVKAKLFRYAEKKVDALMQRKGIKGQFGSIHIYWGELKRVLRQDYSIDWLSPKDLNPEGHYD